MRSNLGQVYPSFLFHSCSDPAYETQREKATPPGVSAEAMRGMWKGGQGQPERLLTPYKGKLRETRVQRKAVTDLC
jgi:hypothetical protein